jgi:ABC-2 type transport system permease protein
MSPHVTWAVGRRVLWQIRRDPRTIALLLVVPVFLLVLLKYVFAGRPGVFRTIGVPLCGLFPFIVMFLITSIAMLRERTSGTLERLMSLPLAKLDLLLGYGLAFAVVAAVQAAVTSTVAFWWLGLETSGPVLAVGALAIANAVLGMSLGLFLSAFASTEFQAVQFMPAVLLPQILLSGLLVPREHMPHALRIVAAALPVTYAYDALARVTADRIDARLWLDVGVTLGATVLALILGAATLRRRTP